MNNNCSLAGYMLEEPSIIIRLSYLLYIFINIYTFYYMHNNNYRCKLCWNKALTFGCFSYHCVHPIHAKMFPIQMLLHFSQIVRRVCTLVLFITLVFIIIIIIINYYYILKLSNNYCIGGNKEWDNFLHDYMKRWKTSLLRIAKFRQKWPTLNVYYEDLKTNATREVHRMLTFLGVPHTTEEVDSQLNEGGPQALHRHHRHRSNGRYFTADQIMFTYNFLMHLQQELRKSGLGDIIERYV